MDREILTYKGAKINITMVSILTLLQSMCIILQAVYLADLISHLFAREEVSNLVQKVLLFLCALVGRYCLSLLIKKIAYRFADRTGTDLRKQFFSTLFELGPTFTQKIGTGKLVTLSLEGTAQMRQYLELFIPKIVGMGIIPIIVLLYVCFQDRISAIILFVTMPVLIMFMVLLGLAAQKKMDMQWDSYRVLSNHFVDSLRGLTTLRYLGLSRSHAITIGRVSDQYRKMTNATLRVAFLSSFALDFFTMLSIAFVAVSLGLRLVNGHILLQPALTILVLAPEYFLPIREFGNDYHATLDGKEAAHDIQSIATTQQNSKDIDAFHVSWDEKSTLTLKNINVQHESDRNVSLKNVQLQFKGFEKIGVVGASGAGKSTLINVLSGFLSPTDGVIQTNGHILPSLAFDHWRHQLTYIPQHPYLFHDTIKKNIAFYHPDASNEQIKEAIKAAGLNEIIASFPKGLEEMIGNGGRTMSGGQEQRVALARAFLCGRPILLLDEPTAHLDVETEYELKKTMIKLFQKKLVIFATHRLHWMEQMDRIIVLKEGKVAEMGTQEELLAKKGEYYELVKTQLEGLQ